MVVFFFFRDLLVLLVNATAGTYKLLSIWQQWELALYHGLLTHTHIHTHATNEEKFYKILLWVMHCNKLTLLFYHSGFIKCKQIYFPNEERKPPRLLVPTEVVEMVCLGVLLIVQRAALSPLSFWKEHKPAGLGGWKLLHRTRTQGAPSCLFS